MGIKREFFIGITAAVAASVIAPVILPVIVRASRPFAVSLLKGGMALYEKGRVALAETGEMMDDIREEVQAELKEKQAGIPSAEEETFGAAANGVGRSHQTASD